MKHTVLFFAFVVFAFCYADNSEKPEENVSSKTCTTAKGVVIPGGKPTWIDPCTFCWCTMSDEASCNGIDCPELNCANPKTPPGKCCPVCS